MARYWKPSKARVRNDIRTALEGFEAISQARHKAIGEEKPFEYRTEVVEAAYLMMQARDYIEEAKTWKPENGKAWVGFSKKNYDFCLENSKATYEQYCALKARIANKFVVSENTITHDIMAAFYAAC